MSRGVVCALEGPAAGGGLSLALACDLRVMARGAFLKVGYVANGLSLDGGGSHALPRLVGLSRATELALLDEPVDAQRSLELGLVHRLADDDDCLDTAIALADRLASMPLGSIGRTKRLFVRAFDNSLERHLDEERRAIAAAADSLEGREGVGAFLDKREPDYRRAIEEDEPEV
jgi:2-(1,2-epoxy-1,2-dihydrophenyl)acetyl-CoA isomerase